MSYFLLINNFKTSRKVPMSHHISSLKNNYKNSSSMTHHLMSRHLSLLKIIQENHIMPHHISLLKNNLKKFLEPVTSTHITSHFFIKNNLNFFKNYLIPRHIFPSKNN
jgi:hypothetical protein